jgi:hypothetical protein
LIIFATEKKEILDIKMKKIAIPTREDMVDDHFGNCVYYTPLAKNNAWLSFVQYNQRTNRI